MFTMRNRFIQTVPSTKLNRMKPKLFIGSSSEGLEIARAMELNLERDAEVTIWSSGLFGLGLGTLETLVNSLNRFDFAALVLTPDDIVTSRETSSDSPRDNVLLELGLFIGHLGRERTFIVYNRDKNLKLPSDLAGVTAADYGDREDSNIQAALSPTCTKIRDTIKSLGTFTHPQGSADRVNSSSSLRPIVTARVTTHSAGNVATAFDLLVHNSGNSPAKNIKLRVNEAEVERAFSDSISENWKRSIQRCFSEEATIPVLENGQSKTNSFGAFGSRPQDTTWKIGSIINVQVTYEDLGGNPYSHDIPLKIADDKGFAGAFWEKGEDTSGKENVAKPRDEAETRERVLALLSQEIAYNVNALKDVYDLVKTEEVKHQKTFKTNEYGGWESEGNPISVLKSFQPETLSQKAWESQIDQAPSVLTEGELESIFSFYGNLNGVAKTQEQFLNYRGNHPRVLFDEVLRKIQTALVAEPKLSK